MRRRDLLRAVAGGALVWGLACGGGGGGGDLDALDQGQGATEDAEVGDTKPGEVHIAGVEVGGVWVEVEGTPPTIRFWDAQGRLIAQTVPGAVRLAEVQSAWSWVQGFVGATQTEVATLDLENGFVRSDSEGLGVTIESASGEALARFEFAPAASGEGVVWAVRTGAPWNQVRFQIVCGPRDRFYGLGGQSHAAEFRGQTIPIRVAEQGLGKDPRLPEGEASLVGHLYDAYFPLPYVLVARPDPDALAWGIVLDSSQRSRFLLCSEDEGTLEIQAACEPVPDGGCEARLIVLPGPTPKDVVRRFTAVFHRPNPVPRWAFGPWVAFVGEPLDVAQAAQSLVAHDIAATAVWDQDWHDYDHPDLSAMVAALHALGLRVLTYFNTFLYEGTPDYAEAVARGFVPTREDGSPYRFTMGTSNATLVDLTNPEAWEWMADRLRHAWDRGVDGWMADYAEWVAPDMRLHDGRTGVEYANRYPVDWARLNHEVLLEKRPDPESALFFSRSGYLGSNEFLRVVWAGDQLTSFDVLDGLPSVIPYGTSLGLSGVSAYGHDIAGYTGVVAPPSTKELYFRWTEIGAWSPVMRTHRGLIYDDNWNWDSDADTIAHFRRYALLHLRLLPYLEALHAEAVATGVPAMRHVVLEFPGWEGAAQAHHEYLLGPSVLVAPVVEEGAVTRTLSLPPGVWYAWEDATLAGGTLTVEAPLDRVPVFLRAGGIVPMLPGDVRGVLPAPGRPSVAEVEARELELRVGCGEPGTLTLADGTVVTMTPAAPGAAVLGVQRTPEGVDLAPCEEGQDPAQADCWLAQAEGRIGVATRLGPGSLVFGAAVVGQQAWEVQVVGGPQDRLYRVAMTGSGPCVNP